MPRSAPHMSSKYTAVNKILKQFFSPLILRLLEQANTK